MRLRRPLALIALALAGVLVTAGCGGSSAEESSSVDGSAAISVDTAFGEVTLDEKPTRVVALGWGDAETALALGVQPVGASDWLAFGGEGVGPWAEGMYDEAPELIGTLEPELEKVAALKPDLILDTKSAGTKERYDALAKIAPTVSIKEGGEQYNTSWEDQVDLVSAALGVSEKGEQLVADTKDEFTATAAEYPQFKGKTAVVGALTSEGYGAYVARDSRVQFLTALGFIDKPEIAELAGDSFSIDVSREQLDLLDADLTVITTIGVENSAVTSDELLAQVPSVRDGHLVTFDDATSLAFSTNTVLSIGAALESVPPILASKLAS
ncbi:iron-siderophore ABC transporter substrate-binding protein [Solicola sp. PLA-1-18]|uniref:iron-siderophore ABC transporter substrate-binding protein n=1 Tax=Solicola sp. PLA-1-18 TaxID=3380532 RepID=UPI003B8004A2